MSHAHAGKHRHHLLDDVIHRMNKQSASALYLLASRHLATFRALGTLNMYRLSTSLTRSVINRKLGASRHHRTMSNNFFSIRPSIQSTRPSIFQLSSRRHFANGRGLDPLATYRSTRAVIWTIIGLNTAVFGAWQYAGYNKDRNLLHRLLESFTSSMHNFKEGRYYTLITSAFSHQMLAHFAFNMFTLNAFGSILAFTGVGGFHMVSLTIGSAAAAPGACLYQQANKPGIGNSYASALGPSGVVMAMGAAATCLMPFAPMQIMFIPINIPLWVLTLAYAGIDTYYLHSNSQIGHAAHLGGAIYGAIYYFAYLRRLGGISHMLRFGRL